MDEDGGNRREEGHSPWLGPAVAFALAALAFAAVGATFRRLFDTDSYLHMALARHLAEEGPRAGIPWARFSVLADGFGDKELLFHAFLIPFATLFPVVRGGLVAMSFLAGAVSATLAWLSLRLAPRAGGWVPLMVLAGSADVVMRVLRVRPETVSLLLLLFALEAGARRRWKVLAAISVLYPLAHVSVPAYVGLFVLLFGLFLWRDGRPEWPLLLVPAVGALAGLLVHPQFPANLRLVKLHAFDVVAAREILDAGPELRPPLLVAVLVLNLGWIASMLVVWRSRRRGGGASDPDSARLALAFGGAALVFAVLNVSIGRFALYAVPFGTVALLASLRSRGEEPGPRVALPFRGSLPTVLALPAALCLGLAPVPRAIEALISAEVFSPDERAEWSALRGMVPDDAKVAAPWGDAEVFAWAIPRARYLNLFDPTLMAVPFPRQYRIQRAVWDGTEPDPVAAAYGPLDSEFILFNRNSDRQILESRLQSDPRAQILFRGEAVLARIEGVPSDRFVLDWEALPVPSAMALPHESEWEKARGWPRDGTVRGKAVEGYVDALRLPSSPCWAFRHRLDAGGGESVYEFAPWASSALLVDGRLAVASGAGTRAVLGKGLLIPMRLSRGLHDLTVTTCQAHERNGFYLVRRS